MSALLALPAFSAFGIELEYMIVDRDSLDVRPLAASLLDALAARDAPPSQPPAPGWSNELVCHVIETKNVAPTPALHALPSLFHDALRDANRLLSSMNAMLMPTAMHPWMDPETETTLWEDDGGIYRTYDRIYGCRAHGWANLQSMHVNLPFADDAQFARLHAATRLILPLLPALAASSPFADGRPAGSLDYRLAAYCRICERTPRVIGDVIPETVDTKAEYDARILAPMYDELAPLDPAGTLRHEWLNSRGAIPRFDRNALEIRLIDVQEHPSVDVAIAAATIAVIQWLYDERSASLADQQAVDTGTLAAVLRRAIRDADEAVVDNVGYLRTLGVAAERSSARAVWRSLLDACARETTLAGAWWRPAIDVILEHGPLARRIVRAVGDDRRRERVRDVYRRLCECLHSARMFQ
jgi:gamma-glutamyl:cysteine ligase YbdK (ATP-grasp superfamily)